MTNRPQEPAGREKLCVMCGLDGYTRPDGSQWGQGVFTGVFKFKGVQLCLPCKVDFTKLPQIERQRIVETFTCLAP